MQGPGSVTTRVLAALALGAALAVLVSGCAVPGAFPAILDNPVPRDDAPLSPDQIKKATDDLISERDHLSAEATAAASASATGTPPNPAPPANAAPGGKP